MIVEGRAELIDDADPFRQAGAAFEAKYGIDVVGDGAEGRFFVLEPGRAFAWLETEFPTTATRFQFDPGESA